MNQCTNVCEENKVRFPEVFRLRFHHGFFDFIIDVIVIVIILLVIGYFFGRIIVNQEKIDLVLSVQVLGDIQRNDAAICRRQHVDADAWMLSFKLFQLTNSLNVQFRLIILVLRNTATVLVFRENGG